MLTAESIAFLALRIRQSAETGTFAYRNCTGGWGEQKRPLLAAISRAGGGYYWRRRGKPAITAFMSSARQATDEAQMLRWWALYSAGDQQSGARIMNALQGLCQAAARKAARRESIPFEDLSQQAALAATEAVSSFDPSRGLSLSSWAAGKIRSELAEFCADNRQLKGLTIRIPRSAWRQMSELKAAESCLKENGQPVSRASLAEISGLSHGRIVQLQALSSWAPAAVDPSCANDPLQDLLRREQQKLVRAAVSRLTPGQQQALQGEDAGRKSRALAALSADRSLASG